MVSLRPMFGGSRGGSNHRALWCFEERRGAAGGMVARRAVGVGGVRRGGGGGEGGAKEGGTHEGTGGRTTQEQDLDPRCFSSLSLSTFPPPPSPPPLFSLSLSHIRRTKGRKDGARIEKEKKKFKSYRVANRH